MSPHIWSDCKSPWGHVTGGSDGIVGYENQGAEAEEGRVIRGRRCRRTFIEVLPSGSKVGRYRYRLNGRGEKITFGAYPDVRLCGERTAHANGIAKHANSWRLGSPRHARSKWEKARGGEDESTFAGFAPRVDAEVLAQQRRADTSRRRLNRATCLAPWVTLPSWRSSW